jgi:hypothetical protein
MKRARRKPPSHAPKTVTRPRYSLADLLLEMPDGVPIDAEWEAIQPVGKEVESAALTMRTIRATRRFMRKQRKLAGRSLNPRRLIDEGRD